MPTSTFWPFFVGLTVHWTSAASDGAPQIPADGEARIRIHYDIAAQSLPLTTGWPAGRIKPDTTHTPIHSLAMFLQTESLA